MALPLLGLNVRLKGAAAKEYTVRYSATFIDGSAVGPVGEGTACEAPGLAAMESFLIELMPKAERVAPVTERPDAVQHVVARDRDEERSGRCEQVVEARVQERGVDGEVDAVADHADGAELAELHPVAARAQDGMRAAADRDLHLGGQRS